MRRRLTRIGFALGYSAAFILVRAEAPVLAAGVGAAIVTATTAVGKSRPFAQAGLAAVAAGASGMALLGAYAEAAPGAAHPAAPLGITFVFSLIAYVVFGRRYSKR
ncbi:MAG: hypothetical protein AAFN74_00140 [Myxococcota bacterium]